MRKIILSGGPHTGKTTLMNGLRQHLSGNVHFVPEPAEILIKEELSKETREPGYRGVFPTTRYAEFVDMVVAKSVELEEAIPDNASIAVLDRSLIDNIGYARLNGQEHLVPNLQRLVTAARYSTALLCDFVGKYTQTAVRPESWEFAQAIHGHLLRAYDESGIEVVHLPAVGVDDRLALAMDIITDLR